MAAPALDHTAGGNRALFVVAKQPQSGQTKTRLCPPLDGGAAAALYAAFLADTLAIMRAVPDVRRGIAYLPSGASAYFRSLAPDMHLVLQEGDSLGERLDCLITQALASGAQQVVVMDSDSPTLPASYVAQAFTLLDGPAEAVFGPCRDGGYYLVGMKRSLPLLLRGVQMSTPTVLAETLALAAQAGVPTALLPEWYDIDTGEELAALAHDLQAAGDGTAQHTRQALDGLGWLPAPVAGERSAHGR